MQGVSLLLIEALSSNYLFITRSEVLQGNYIQGTVFRAICPRPVRNGLPVEHREQSRAGGCAERVITPHPASTGQGCSGSRSPGSLGLLLPRASNSRRSTGQGQSEAALRRTQRAEPR